MIINAEKYWRDALIHVFSETVLTIPKMNNTNSSLYYVKEGRHFWESTLKVLKVCNYTEHLKIEEEFDQVFAATEAVHQIMGQLKSFDFIGFEFSEHAIKTPEFTGRERLHTYKTSTEGIGVALKLQEHIDNEHRFNLQESTSKTLETNSTISVATAKKALLLSSCVAVIAIAGVTLSFLRWDALQDKVTSLGELEARMLTAEGSVKELLSKNVDLNGQLVALTKDKEQLTIKLNTIELQVSAKKEPVLVEQKAKLEQVKGE